MIQRLTLCVAGLMLVGCSDTVPADSSLESAGTEGPGSRLCMPVDDEGTASFAWESVENTATEDVEVVGVTVDDDTVEVTEWFLTVEDWRQAGVSRGALARPGPAKLPTTLGAGKRALVAMSVHADGVTEARRLQPTVVFEGADGRGELELEWGLEIIPADQTCG